ncbi:MAG: zinc-ribbon domain-containing protein [Acutalibacteraceae bacterium]
MYCSKCGAQNSGQNKFCPNCGNPLYSSDSGTCESSDNITYQENIASFGSDSSYNVRTDIDKSTDQATIYGTVPPTPDIFAAYEVQAPTKPIKKKKGKGCLIAFLIVLGIIIISCSPFLVLTYLRTAHNSNLPENSFETSAEQTQSTSQNDTTEKLK